jgi:hypothetical protein
VEGTHKRKRGKKLNLWETTWGRGDIGSRSRSPNCLSCALVIIVSVTAVDIVPAAVVSVVSSDR